MWMPLNELVSCKWTQTNRENPSPVKVISTGWQQRLKPVLIKLPVLMRLRTPTDSKSADLQNREEYWHAEPQKKIPGYVPVNSERNRSALASGDLVYFWNNRKKPIGEKDEYLQSPGWTGVLPPNPDTRSTYDVKHASQKGGLWRHMIKSCWSVDRKRDGEREHLDIRQPTVRRCP